MKEIRLAKPFFDVDEVEAIREVLESGWVSQGPKVKEFESKCSNYLGVEHAIAVSNCTAALHISLLSIDIEPCDEVLVPDFTFPATGHAVLHSGGNPVFVDVSEQDYNIDLINLKKAITPKTKAIIPVHTFGNPCKMEEIMNFAEENNLFVIEDGACAFGSKRDGKFAGTFGDIGCFSFHARKGISTGEGGLVVTDNQKLASKIRNLSTFGIRYLPNNGVKFSPPIFENAGFNYKLSDIAASIGICQLNKIEKIIERKISLANYYNQKFSGLDFLQVPIIDVQNRSVFQSYVVNLKEGINRNLVITKLKENGIQSQIGYYASHIQPAYSSKVKCRTSLQLSESTLALPLFYELNENEIDIVVEKLIEIVSDLK